MTQYIRKKHAVVVTQEDIDTGWVYFTGEHYAGMLVFIHKTYGRFFGQSPMVPGSYKPSYEDMGYPQIGVYVDDWGRSYATGEIVLDIRVLTWEEWDYYIEFGVPPPSDWPGPEPEPEPEPAETTFYVDYPSKTIPAHKLCSTKKIKTLETAEGPVEKKLVVAAGKTTEGEFAFNYKWVTQSGYDWIMATFFGG